MEYKENYNPIMTDPTIVTILKIEKAGYEKAGALCDVKLNFFTDEKEERFMRMKIEPISNRMMYYLMITYHNQLSFDKKQPSNWHLNTKA